MAVLFNHSCLLIQSASCCCQCWWSVSVMPCLCLLLFGSGQLSFGSIQVRSDRASFPFDFLRINRKSTADFPDQGLSTGLWKCYKKKELKDIVWSSLHDCEYAQGLISDYMWCQQLNCIVVHGRSRLKNDCIFAFTALIPFFVCVCPLRVWQGDRSAEWNIQYLNTELDLQP